MPDFGFYHDFEFVSMAVEILRLSNWNCWPESGGWATQDQRLIEDLMTYMRLEERLKWEVEHGVPADVEEVQADMTTMRMDDL